MTFLSLSLLLNYFAASGLGQAPLKESDAKAHFVSNLIKLAEWPPESQAAPVELKPDDPDLKNIPPFVVGVYGKNPFGESASIISEKKVRGRPLVIIEFKSIEEARTNAHVLFITPDKANLAELIEGLKGSSVLTVSDAEGFVDHGGMIGLAVEKRRIIFRVNFRALANAKIVLPSQVLNLAREIKR